MKILLVSQYYYPERFSVTDFAEELAKLGNEVTVLTGKPNYGFNDVLADYKNIKEETVNGVSIKRVNLVPRKECKLSIVRNYFSFHRNAKKFVRHLDKDFDIVLGVSLSPIISVSAALKYAKKYNVPSILYCQDLWPEAVVAAGIAKRNSLIYKVLYKWSKSIYSRFDQIVISSPSFKVYFEKELNIKDKVFDVINQPIIKSNKQVEPIKYENKHNVVYAGNLGTMQMIESLVEAMKYVKTDDTKLHLLGNGSQLELIQKKIIDEKLQNKVEYHGNFPIEQAEAYFANSEALIVSLKDTGYIGKTIPNKAIQYLKYSKPILGVINGDTKTLLEKAKGTIFSTENPQNIAENLDILLNMTDKEKAQMGRNNLKYFEDNFTIEKLTHLLLDKLIEVKK